MSIETVEDLMNKLKEFNPKSRVILEVARDLKISEVYEDGKNDVCIYSKGEEIA